MATAQPTRDAMLTSDRRFRYARKRVLFTSLALGVFVLLVVPIHSTFIADPRALADERYLFAACRLGFPFTIPGSVCPRVVAGESPFLFFYYLVAVPLLLIRGRTRTMLIIAVLSLIFALLQGVFVFYTIFPTSLFPPNLNPDLLTSPFERDPTTCWLVMCGVDHTLFHLSQVPFLLALAFFGYRAAREDPNASHSGARKETVNR
jgi:hypothetical protein